MKEKQKMKESIGIDEVDTSMISESELKACRLAWSAFKVPSRTNNGPELMDDGVRYLRLSSEPVTGVVRRAMLFKAGEVLSANLLLEIDEVDSSTFPFQVFVVSFGLCWNRRSRFLHI